ncbi:sucrase ferredoxin [Nocardioides astragali]|uniref:Sucrase ferredoxin n=1 Tax=Nocardioides astragali TaxID=1776736 RepID=A0ABW2N4S8_9ACTN|nr:sucrase ferredoxin [Nocardioides astragali]
MTPFRCAAASLARNDDLAGTASTVRSFLLVEHRGAWGVEALRDARLPDGLGDHLSRTGRRSGVRVLLVRRPGRRAGQAGVRVFAARAAGADSWLEAGTLATVDDVRGLDLTALGQGRSPGLDPYDGPLLAVCTHGRHDACCAERGRPVALALARSRHADAVWECSHIGGDRFAGNLLVLPRGLYYGRVDPDAALDVADAAVEGRVSLDHLRGRSDMPMPVQAAEIHVRRLLDLRGLDDVRPTAARTEADLTTVTLDAGDRTVRVQVLRVLEAARQLTCGALRDNPVPRYEVELLG